MISRLFILTLLLGVSSIAFSADLNERPKSELGEAPRHELLKCYSAEQGTVWMSFGHLIRHGSSKLETFAAEIAYFPNDGMPYRKVYWTFQESLDAVAVRVRETGMAVEFTAEGLDRRLHKIQLIQNPKVKQSFLGNWMMTNALSGEVINGPAFCTVH